MSKIKTKLNRRNFLLAVGAGGAATAAAMAARVVNPAAARPAAAGDDKRQGKGYQETAHVRSYYNTAKV
jgi:anaerobic selenocysteine-containing dehydrogenase